MIDIIASKEKSQTSRGANQDQTGSFTREKSLPPIKDVGIANPAPELIAKRGMTAQDTVGFVTKPFASASPVHSALPPHGPASGSPGGHLGVPTRPVTRR